MGGFRKTYGDERGELLASGLGGETQYVPVSVSPLHSPGFWDQIHDVEPSGPPQARQAGPYQVDDRRLADLHASRLTAERMCSLWNGVSKGVSEVSGVRRGCQGAE